jgi:hypothetical protein
MNTKFSISLQTVDIERPRIFQLQDGDNIINREDDLKRHIGAACLYIASIIEP